MGEFQRLYRITNWHCNILGHYTPEKAWFTLKYTGTFKPSVAVILWRQRLPDHIFALIGHKVAQHFVQQYGSVRSAYVPNVMK